MSNTARAITKYVRVSPQKARLAAGLIRGLSVSDAAFQLAHCSMKGGRYLLKTLESAIANAENVQNIRREDLKVLEVRVDGGPTMARSKPKNKGGRHRIIKRTSHLSIIVGE